MPHAFPRDDRSKAFESTASDLGELSRRCNTGVERDKAGPMKDLVRFEVAEGVATLTLDAPPANTYSYEMMQALDAAVLRARMDDSVHAIVLIGEGDKFFCAGADIAMLNEVTPSFKYYFCLHANETLNRLRANSEAGDRRDQRPLRRRWARSRDGGRFARRQSGQGQARPARSDARRAPPAPAAHSGSRACSVDPRRSS